MTVPVLQKLFPQNSLFFVGLKRGTVPSPDETLIRQKWHVLFTFLGKLILNCHTTRRKIEVYLTRLCTANPETFRAFICKFAANEATSGKF